MNICLCKMTKLLCRQYLSNFAHDPDIFLEMSRFSTYIYSQEQSDAYWQRQRDLKRIHLAVMLDDVPIGEVILKNIDRMQKTCTLGIHMQNDAVKNRGFGTKAEILAIEYAFHDMGMETVFADAIQKNKRSQHVLLKVGFIETHADDAFRYYRCDKSAWRAPEA